MGPLVSSLLWGVVAISSFQLWQAAEGWARWGLGRNVCHPLGAQEVQMAIGKALFAGGLPHGRE